MHEAKLSNKNQIVIPRAVRDVLGVKSGDRLLMVVRGATVILLPRPKRYSSAVSGIGKGFYPDEHLEKERRAGGKKRSTGGVSRTPPQGRSRHQCLHLSAGGASEVSSPC